MGRRIIAHGVKDFESEVDSLAACLPAPERRRLSVLATRLVREYADR
jgi:hypothetical protein